MLSEFCVRSLEYTSIISGRQLQICLENIKMYNIVIHFFVMMGIWLTSHIVMMSIWLMSRIIHNNTLALKYLISFFNRHKLPSNNIPRDLAIIHEVSDDNSEVSDENSQSTKLTFLEQRVPLRRRRL
jgi:hypothetical protein